MVGDARAKAMQLLVKLLLKLYEMAQLTDDVKEIKNHLMVTSSAIVA